MQIYLHLHLPIILIITTASSFTPVRIPSTSNILAVVLPNKSAVNTTTVYTVVRIYMVTNQSVKISHQNA
ncbi:hypothetical protein GYMLUDRAFT_402412 [Collybiopsis luxurians FD-317 M1]|nr:hypothetical protein GYMLUDRAFT_402412 [Collybiopsis luxurians FD-317 M1]